MAASQKGIALQEQLEITVRGIDYILVSNSEDIPSPLKGGDKDLQLAVVYKTEPGQTVSKSVLQDFRRNVLEKDDVFQADFLANLVFYGASQQRFTIDDGAIDELRFWGTQSWDIVEESPDSKLAVGPYVIRGEKTWQPWRVYRDHNACFMKTFLPGTQAKGSVCTDLVLLDEKAGVEARVAVPSRCYFKPTPCRPLDGARISVKDNIDVENHKNTLCNRAWDDLYPPAAKHAACVQAVIDAGAIIVGKVKLQAMIMREEPLECVEFSAPFNPRGDGYQVPSGSSHGSAAGIASYDWLDYSFGSDTNGSGRKPAHYNGCFSIRPTTGILDTTGVVGQFDKFDMPVIFGRDITTFDNFISTWYGGSKDLKPVPTNPKVKILYPRDYLPTSNKDQSSVIDDFVKGLEKAYQVQRIEVSLADMWAEDLPDGSENNNLAEYLEITGAYPYYYDSYAATEGFRKGYEEKHGKPPFVHRYTLWQWDISKNVTKDQRDYYWRRSELYRQWLLDRVFEATSDTITIMVFPIEVGKPNYRDTTPPPFAMLSGYSSLNMSPMMRAPEVTAVAGQIEFASIVTKRREPYPVGVSVIGSPGTDRILVEMVVNGLKAASIPTRVKTGTSVY